MNKKRLSYETRVTIGVILLMVTTGSAIIAAFNFHRLEVFIVMIILGVICFVGACLIIPKRSKKYDYLIKDDKGNYKKPSIIETNDQKAFHEIMKYEHGDISFDQLSEYAKAIVIRNKNKKEEQALNKNQPSNSHVESLPAYEQIDQFQKGEIAFSDMNDDAQDQFLEDYDGD